MDSLLFQNGCLEDCGNFVNFDRDTQWLEALQFNPMSKHTQRGMPFSRNNLRYWHASWFAQSVFFSQWENHGKMGNVQSFPPLLLGWIPLHLEYFLRTEFYLSIHPSIHIQCGASQYCVLVYVHPMTTIVVRCCKML